MNSWLASYSARKSQTRTRGLYLFFESRGAGIFLEIKRKKETHFHERPGRSDERKCQKQGADWWTGSSTISLSPITSANTATRSRSVRTCVGSYDARATLTAVSTQADGCCRDCDRHPQ